MAKFEFNRKKLSLVSSSLQVVGLNINVEIYNQEASLKLLDALNLSVGDDGVLDMQMEQTRSLIKFLKAQQDLINKVAVLTHQS